MTESVRDSSVSLVAMRPESLGTIMEIERSCFSDPWSERAFRQTLASGRSASLVAIDRDTAKPIGYVVAWFVMDEGEIANVAVAPGWRGRGVGGMLLDSVLELAGARGVTTVYLEVRETNSAALHLYASRGFEQVGRRRGYYRKPKEDALVLRRKLREREESGS
jgi:[ribosomal protein S18]-alanine N-acetyltransferase